MSTWAFCSEGHPLSTLPTHLRPGHMHLTGGATSELCAVRVVATQTVSMWLVSLLRLLAFPLKTGTELLRVHFSSISGPRRQGKVQQSTGGGSDV